MKHLSTAIKARVLQSLSSGMTPIASSVDALQTGISPATTMMKHLDPQHYGHDLALLPSSRRMSYGAGHAR